jgi:hypothetical protein
MQVDRGGLSVLRDGASDEEFEITYGEMKRGSDAKGKERYFHGVCSFHADRVRYHRNSRFLGIFDTAIERRPHHADIGGPPMGRKDQERRWKTVIDIIGPSLVPVDAFRGGTFVKHSRAIVP